MEKRQRERDSEKSLLKKQKSFVFFWWIFFYFIFFSKTLSYKIINWIIILKN